MLVFSVLYCLCFILSMFYTKQLNDTVKSNYAIEINLATPVKYLIEMIALHVYFKIF